MANDRAEARRRAAPPSADEIDAMVIALVRLGSWPTLKQRLRELGMPASGLLVDIMNRQILRNMLRHPETIPPVLAELQTAEEEIGDSDERSA